MKASEAKAMVARELAAAFEGSVDHAFIHGLEGFPHTMGRDFDLIVRDDERHRAVDAAKQRFQRLGWSFRAHRRLNGHVWCFVAPPGRQIVLEFDLIQRLRWASAILADGPRATTQLHGFRIDPWASFAKRILLQVLGGRLDRFRERPDDLEISSAERSVVPALLAEHVGSRLAGALVDAIEHRDLERLHRLRPLLRRAAILRSVVRRPLSTAASVVDWLRNELASSSLAAPVFPIVAVVGVDGVGKSSVITPLELEMRARLPILRVEKRHWRPRVLPSLGRLFGTVDRGTEHVAKPPRRTAGRGQFLRVAYYGLDYLLGGRRDRNAAAQLAVVIYDRCILDMLVDPVRFGLRNSSGVSVIRRLVRDPDLVVLLHDDAARIRARKGELDASEIDRQQAAWQALANEGAVHVILLVRDPPSVVATHVVDCVIDRLFDGARDLVRT